MRTLGADPTNGVIVVFSFSDRPEAVRRAMRAGAKDLSPRPYHDNKSLTASRRPQRGDQVVLTQRTQHAHIDEALRWPGREIGLTERESELLSLLSTGMTNQ